MKVTILYPSFLLGKRGMIDLIVEDEVRQKEL